MSPRSAAALQTGRKWLCVPHGGREAITNYETLQRFGDAQKPVISLVRCRLETGRTHQIRVHMAHIGHPIVGDPGLWRRAQPGQGLARGRPTAIAGLGRQALHATSLGFIHPLKDETFSYNSPLPEDMAVLLNSSGADVN